jgi:hypothetical protein
MGIKRGELLILIGTLYIICINSVFIIINVINFKEGIKAFILRPLYLINKRVSY